MIKNLFKRYKYTVCFLMKSGAQIYVKCQSIDDLIKDSEGKLKYIELGGVEEGRAYYIDIGEVAAIQYVKN